MSDKNSQFETNKRWQETNPTKAKYLSDRSIAKSFIQNQASLEDLAELEQLIEERKNVLPR